MLYEIMAQAPFGVKLAKCRSSLDDGPQVEREIAFHLFEHEVMLTVHDVANRIGAPIGSPPRRASADADVGEAFNRLPPLLTQLQGGGADERLAQLVRETVWYVSLIRASALGVDLPVFASPGKSGTAASTTGVRSATASEDSPAMPVSSRGTVDYTKTGKAFIKGPGDADNGVGYTDVRQSQDGDCWLMASLIAVARKKPDLIYSMVVDNGNGTYNVTLRNVAGTWFWKHDRTFVVRAVFPAEAGTGVPYAAQVGNQDAAGHAELWPMLIEKAWAVLKGGYDKLEQAGFAEDALASLTGNSVDCYRNSGKTGAELLKLMDDADKAGKPVVAVTDKRPQEDRTIFAPHAYCFMGIVDGKFFLRNPWGHHHPPLVAPADFQRRFCAIAIGNIE